jgi:hypothetical protein
VLLAIEIAESSLRFDLGRKARIYAGFGRVVAGVPGFPFMKRCAQLLFAQLARTVC